MFKKITVLLVVLLAIGLLLNACAGSPATQASEVPPTVIPPTATISPTDTPLPPTPTKPPPTATEPPPTATPTEEPIALNPSPRGYVNMAYDSESKQVILFGGQTGDVRDTSGETWAFDVTTQTWTEMRPPESPAEGAARVLAYDSESDRVILFDFQRVETWAYDYNTNTWTKMKGIGPRNHLGTVIAYDAESDRIILFGGLNARTFEEYFNDTWAYDYNKDTWTEMKPDVSPPGQNYQGMTYDTAADRIISWGGDNRLPHPIPDYPQMDSRVWAYDYNTNTWQEKSPNKGPGPRCCHGLAYADSTSLVYMYGGTESGTSEMRTYNFKSNTWDRIEASTPFPPSLSRFAMVYIPDTEQLVVFGGQVGGRQFNYTNQTWIYDVNTGTWSEVTRES